MGMFPVAASPALIAGVTGGLVGLGAVASAFSGVIADPIQRRLGLHRRRLLRLIGALEAQFFSDEAAGLVVRLLGSASLAYLSRCQWKLELC